MYSSNKQLISILQQEGVLRTPRIINAFKKVDRKLFVPYTMREFCYHDSALPLGYADATISQPTTVAYMLELLQPRKSDRVLDIGSGSGYVTALLAYIVGKRGKVIGLEVDPELIEFGQKNLIKYTLPWASIQTAGSALGIPGKEFDTILVSAAAQRMPKKLFKQLSSPGCLVAPVKHSLWKVEKDVKGNITMQEHPGFMFVPLQR